MKDTRLSGRGLSEEVRGGIAIDFGLYVLLGFLWGCSLNTSGFADPTAASVSSGGAASAVAPAGLSPTDITTVGTAGGESASGGSMTGGDLTGGNAKDGSVSDRNSTGGRVAGVGGTSGIGLGKSDASIDGPGRGGGGILATGGNATGGVAAAGIATGGLATGGITISGLATGGLATGGLATGGLATGGLATGGLATGGLATGGLATGGLATGGLATGGIPCVLGAFGAPEKLTGFGLSLNLAGPSLSADGLTLYFAASATGQPEDIFVATRTDRGAQFGAAVAVLGVNTSSADGSPCLSYDGLTLYFYSDRPGGLGARDLWLAQRADLQGVFGNVRLLANVNSSYWDHEEWLSRDELTLLFVSTRPGVGRSDIWMATRTQRTDDFSAPTTLAGIDTVAREDRPAISSDGLTIIFASDRTGTMGDLDLWIATRSTLQSDFSTPTNLKTLNSAVWDADPTFSADDRELFFASPRSGSAELYRSVRTCQ